jgi:hypothetical protein
MTLEEFSQTWRDNLDACRADMPDLFEALTCHSA